MKGDQQAGSSDAPRVVTVALISSEDDISQPLASGRLWAEFIRKELRFGLCHVAGPSQVTLPELWAWFPNDDISIGCLGGGCI